MLTNSLTDCIAEGPDQLMYIQGDTLVLLRDDGDDFLAYCEGEVGWVKRQNVSLDALASSSAPTSPRSSVPQPHRVQFDDYDSNEGEEGGDTPVMQSATWTVMGDSSGAEHAHDSRVVAVEQLEDAEHQHPRGDSAPASGSSHSSQQQGLFSTPTRPRRSSGRPPAAVIEPTPPVHSRNHSSTSASTDSSLSTNSEPIGSLVFGSFNQYPSERLDSDEG